MRISPFLLVCSVGLLMVTQIFAAPAAPRGKHNLIEILQNIQTFNCSHVKDSEQYLDSARQFAEGPGRCGNKFFCAVHDTLQKHFNHKKHKSEERLLGNLQNFNRHTNCTVALANTTNTTEQLTLCDFMSDIERCIRCRNLDSNSTTC